MNCEREAAREVSANIGYIREHTEITNVLVTGGDVLMPGTKRIEAILKELRKIPHVNIMRAGSRLLACNPYRILNGPDLISVLPRYSTPKKRIHLMAHFNHPRELTVVPTRAAGALNNAGVIVVNQTPILNGVNSDPATLTSLFCQKSWQACPGLVKRARFVMSHATGKIEMAKKTAGHVFMRYRQAADPANIGESMIFKSSPVARWFDDCHHALTDFKLAKFWLS